MAEHNRMIDKLCAILQKNKALNDLDAQALVRAFGERSGATFEEFLLEEGLVEKKELLKALEEYFQTTAVDVTGLELNHHLVHMFPKDVMLRNLFVPWDREGDVLSVIAVNPRDPQLPEIVGKFVSYDVAFVAGFARDINDAIEDYYDESLVQHALDQTPVDELREEYEAQKKRGS